MEIQKPKQKVKIDHLINWYFGNCCAKCGRIDLESGEYGQKCLRKIKEIKKSLEVDKMTHKQFVNIIRNTSFCHPFTRKFTECGTCKRFGINNNYWIKNWDGGNLGRVSPR